MASLSGGYKSSDRWSTRLSYVDLGKGRARLVGSSDSSAQKYHSNVSQVTPVLGRGLSLSVDYALLKNETWRLEAGGGMYGWRASFKSQYQGEAIKTSENGVNPYLMLAAKAQLNDNWSLGARVSRYFIRYNDVTTISAVLEYHFD